MALENSDRTEPRAREEEERERVKPEVVRPELNVEKWPAAWAPSHARVTTTRVLRREERLPDGTVRRQEVQIPHVSGLGTLNTDDKKTWYSLVKVWEDAGRPTDRLTTLSVYEIAKLRRVRWSGRAHQELVRSLFRIRDIPFRFIDSFTIPGEQGEQGTARRVTQTINLLTDLILLERNDGKGRGFDPQLTLSGFRFHPEILRLLIQNHTKPLFLDTVMAIKGEIALLLYGYLDLVLSSRSHFERNLAGLFEELGLTGASYRARAHRRLRIRPALKELEGKPVTTGILKSLRLEVNAAGGDDKLVVEKDELPPELAGAISRPVGEGRAARRAMPMTPRQEILLQDIIEFARDDGSRAYFAHLTQVLPEELIYRAISEARVETHSGQVRSRGAYLTAILKRLAQERGYEISGGPASTEAQTS